MEECCNCGCEIYEEDVIWDDDGAPWCPDCADMHDIYQYEDAA